MSANQDSNELSKQYKIALDEMSVLLLGLTTDKKLFTNTDIDQSYEDLKVRVLDAFGVLESERTRPLRDVIGEKLLAMTGSHHPEGLTPKDWLVFTMVSLLRGMSLTIKTP